MFKKLSALVLSVCLVVLSACGASTSSAPASSAAAPSTAASEAAPLEAASEDGGTVTSMQEEITFELPVTGIGTEVSSDIKADEPYKCAVIIKNTSNPYMLKVGDGAIKAAEDMGFETTVYAPTTPDSVEEQVSLMETAIQTGVDMFIIVPVDSQGIMPGVELALEQGIPMTAIGTAPTTEVFLRTGYDYIHAGYTTAKTLAEAAGGKGGAIVLEGPPGAQNAQECLTGINQALAEYPDIEILASQTANYRRTDGMQVMENLIQKYKDDLDIVVAANDEMAIGAVQALKAAGINADVVTGGPGGTKDACQAIADGDLYCAYNTDPYGGAYLGCAYMVEYLNNGATPPQYFIPFPSKETDPMITAENVEYFSENQAWWKD